MSIIKCSNCEYIAKDYEDLANHTIEAKHTGSQHHWAVRRKNRIAAIKARQQQGGTS